MLKQRIRLSRAIFYASYNLRFFRRRDCGSLPQLAPNGPAAEVPACPLLGDERT
jgi:hypothetical protein